MENGGRGDEGKRGGVFLFEKRNRKTFLEGFVLGAKLLDYYVAVFCSGTLAVTVCSSRSVWVPPPHPLHFSRIMA